MIIRDPATRSPDKYYFHVQIMSHWYGHDDWNEWVTLVGPDNKPRKFEDSISARIYFMEMKGRFPDHSFRVVLFKTTIGQIFVTHIYMSRSRSLRRTREESQNISWQKFGF